MSRSLRALAELEAVVRDYGGGAAARKLAALARLERAALPTADAVARLHEALAFLRAYPDSARLEARAARMLAGFARRRDLRRHREALADSGIAGTTIRFRFFSAMASWLAARWPDRLAIDWDAFEDAERLETFLPLFAAWAELPGLDEYDLGLRGWLRRMAGGGNEAAFLVRRFHAMAASDLVLERLWDELDPPLVLEPGAGPRATPSRTLAFHARAPRARQERPLARTRPDLRAVLDRMPQRVRLCSREEGEALVDLARAAMVTRSRDLDAFSYGDPADVRLFDWGEGLAFACIGVRPERRLMLESVYAFLTLRNGVPIGYVLNSALFGSAEIAYNVFDTYRGAEAGPVYAKVLAMVRHLFGADTFTIYPYQLGDGNEEAIASGAWWFYRKFGFAPRDRATLGAMRKEERVAARHPDHRSSPATLRRLARGNLYYALGPRREDVIGRLDLAAVGLAVTDALARRWGADRERALDESSREAARMLGVAPAALARWAPAERLWWRRWAPLVGVLPGLARWRPAERRALAGVIRAKGGRRESDFVRAFDAHPRLRAAIATLAATTRA